MTAREVLDGIKTLGHSAGCAAHDDCLRASTSRLTRAVEAVLNLHAPRTDGSDEPYCRHCHQAPYGHAPYPCPTVAAIENALGEAS